MTIVRPGRGAPTTASGLTNAAVGERDCLAALQCAALGAGRDAERLGCLDIEAAGPFVLDERVAHRRDTVLDREDEDAIAVALERLARPQLVDLDWVAQLAEDAAERAVQVVQTRRPVDGEPLVALAQREGLEHARQPEVVIGVKVRDEDLVQVGQADRRAHQLPLGSLGAVEEQPFAAAAHEQRGRGATCGRRAGRGAEEDEVEVHAVDCR